MGEGECEPLLEEQPKKSRHRKKHLYNMILQQMEFYFSDSNLSKDRFLSQLLTESSCVDINIFLKFNKIIKLNCTVEDIQKAIRKSDIIELSEDGQKLHRKKPIKIKENVDPFTIYVENIKADATHDTLSQVFSDFGNVVYVSIPKYKHNKANKGFAFIEYETEEQANEAITFFDSIGCKISSEKNPEELQSIATFEGVDSNKPKQENQDNKDEKMDDFSEGSQKRKLSSDVSVENRKLKTDAEVSIAENQTDAVEETDGKKKKNKIESKGCKNPTAKNPEELQSAYEGNKLCKAKQGNHDDKDEKIDDFSETSQKRKLSSQDNVVNKKVKKDKEKSIAGIQTDVVEEEINGKEISKKRKLSSENNVENKKIKIEDEGSISGNQTDVVEEMEGKKKKNKKEKRKNYIKELGMQVLSKKDWKKLRNRYLDLQKKKMKEFKQYLHRQKFSQKSHDKKKYQQEEKEMAKANKEAEEVIEEVKKLSYIPGVIVKLKLPEPCMDVKKLKNEIKSISSEVKYVDIPLPAGSEEVFIRFNTNDAAKSFCNKDFNGEKTVIEGKEEENYWDKIKNDRTVKFQKSHKKQRGREKLLKKAEKESLKHLRFDENDL